MFIAITMDIPWSVKYGSAEPRNDFWSRFEASQRNPERRPDGSEPIPEERVVEYERQFRLNFPSALARHLNDELGRAVKRSKRSVKDIIGSPELEVRLLTLEYGSITAAMDIVGISNSDLRDFVLATLNVYGPAAFRDVMNSQVTLTASSTVIGQEFDPVIGGRADQALPSKGLAALGQAWMVANISLVLPFGLAVAICYIAFNSMIHEIDAARTESAAMGSERTEIIKALVAQNSKLAESQTVKASSIDMGIKGFNDLLLAVLKARIGDVSGGQPASMLPAPGK